MNTIFSSLNKGVSGLKASEIQIDVTGNNIANANSTFYTRQRAIQTTAGFYDIRNGVELGMGTTIESIVRLHNEYSYYKLKTATTQVEYTGYMKQKLEEIAERFPDIQTTGILNDLETYNKAWNDFATAPNDGAVKANLIRVAQTFTQSINKAYADIYKIEQTINDDIKMTVDEINEIAQEIANINKQISGKEVLPTDHANELRDRRDELELTLSKLVDAVASKSIIKQNSRLDEGGSESTMTDGGKYYNLTIQGHEVVSGPKFRPLKLITDEVTGMHRIVIQGIDEKITDLTTKISGGKLGAQLDLRGREWNKSEAAWEDGTIQGYKDMLNTFAKTMIVHTNNIYASSAKKTLTSDPLKNLTTSTNLTGFDKHIQTGSFDIVLYDEKGVENNRKTIKIDIHTTMQDIISQIQANTDDNKDNNPNNDIDDLVSAIYQYDSRDGTGVFQLLSKNPNFKIAIEDNGTNFPGAFNIGGFFSGDNATTMRVKSELLQDPSLLRASKNGNDGDNKVANKLLQLQYDEIDFYNRDGTVITKALDGYYRLFTGKVASDGETNNFTHATNTTLYNTVYEDFQSKNGVNTNEELAALIQYQASYGAASKVITTVDKMLDTLLSVKQ